MTIPVSFQNGQIIKDVQIIQNNWKIKHLKSIKNIYGSCDHFDEVFNLVEKVLMQKSKFLVDYTLLSMELILNKISYNKKNIFVQSKEKISGKKNDLIINICKHFKSNSYLSGDGAKNYIDENYLKKKT